MNSQIVVSRKSISKQLLVNNLGLIPELANIVKEFTFYDKVSQVSRILKNELISSLGWGRGLLRGQMFTEGTALLAEGSRTTTVRYRHTAIQLPEFIHHNLQFISCHTCGGYIESNTVRLHNVTHSVICHCGVVDLIDDDEEEEDIAIAQDDEDDEDYEGGGGGGASWYDDEDYYNGGDYEYS